MLRFLMSCLSGRRVRPPAARPSSPPPGPAPRARLIDVGGMLRQSSTRVSVDQLVRKGKKHIHLLSGEKIDELINRSVKTIVDKHRATAERRDADSAARIQADSRAEFEELLQQFQRTADATNAVEESKQKLDEELEEIRFELAPEAAAPEVADARESATLRKRLDKLGAYVATLEAALKTLSTAKAFSNQQVQNILRDLGLASADKNYEKKKDMLKIVLQANQGIRRKARELAARGITLDAPEERAVFTREEVSLSGAYARSSA